MLNCKRGDLAIVVSSEKSTSPNIGKIVRCLNFIPKNTTDKLIWTFPIHFCEDAWEVDVLLEFYMAGSGVPLGKAQFALDYYLRPIRPLDDEIVDEMPRKLDNAPC